jgi:uncharacterized protein (TIGR02147 family)
MLCRFKNEKEPHMAVIYDYLNYRDFIRDFYKEQKAKKASYSFQVMANKAGFKSKSFFADVISGKKNLSRNSVFSMAKALGLTGKAFSYFEALVAFNQASSHDQKNHFFEKLSEFNKRSKSKQVLKEQYEFYSRWYHHTIRELITIIDFKEDYNLLARLVQPSITAGQARESVRLLIDLGLIRKRGTRYILADNIITTGDEVRSVAVTNFHLQNLHCAAQSITNCSSEARDISSIVAVLSPHGFATVKEEIQRFRKKLLSIVDSDNAQKRVYHINFQLFPTSKEHDK